MKGLTIYTAHDISSAYSCLLYLKEELSKSYDIKIWSGTIKKNYEKEDFANKNIYSFYTTWFGSIPKIRVILIQIFVFIKMLFSTDHILVNDLDFIIQAYYVKKLFPNRKVILYLTEIYGKDISLNENIINFYKNHADFPDIIIECLKERAKFRKENYNVSKEIYVIDNTIPKNGLQFEMIDEAELLNYLPFKNSAPIITYAGAVTDRGNLDDLIVELSKVNEDFNFVAFCHGTNTAVQHLEECCQKHLKFGTYKINQSINRKKLLSILTHTDIGIVFYDPKYSLNYFYAAPSKFYEYISLGLNILSTNNEGINNIINQHNLGMCIEDNDSIGRTVDSLLSKGLNSKEYIKDIFEKNYCYEAVSFDAINKIKEILSK